MESKIEKFFEDIDLLVLNKPSGLIVNRSGTALSDTLQDLLEVEYKYNEGEDGGGEFVERSGIVHRLDKDTSGLLVVAKNEKAFKDLLSQFKERKAEKEYIAVLCGCLEGEIIEVDAPLKRSPKTPLKFAVVAGGREAFTRFEKQKCLNLDGDEFTLVKVFPKTGRTHQIRVHSLAINHPIAGDNIYCTNKLLEICKKHFSRLMLHSYKLGFFHPKTHKFIQFESKIPEEFSL